MADEILRLADDGCPHVEHDPLCECLACRSAIEAWENTADTIPVWMQGILRNNDLTPFDEDDLFADWQDTGGSD